MSTHIKSNNILVIGGAGYIGSHMLLALKKAGFHPVVLDNLSTGHREAVLDSELIVGDLANPNILEALFLSYPFSAVMHFAAYTSVPESVQDPLKYYQNNLFANLNLFQLMLKYHVNKLIFSSTASVYGEPKVIPIDESHSTGPLSPYGKSKWMMEQMLHDLSLSHGLRYAVLRYFNAAGADPEERLCERHDPEHHLIPLVLQAALGKRDSITIFGQDYPTPDGTCIRDYVHVTDLCEAHLLALQALLAEEKSFICNLGVGRGFSVTQVIETARRVTERPIRVNIGKRRPGDPASLVADNKLAREKLGWQPYYPDLESMIRHAWAVLR